MSLRYSIVIPIFNEYDNIRELNQRVHQVMNSLAGSYEVIYVDDGSLDESLDILKELAQRDPRSKVLALDKNYGQHPAVVAGMTEAQGEYIITLDADLQNPPEEIPKLLSAAPGCDMVAGRRLLRQDGFVRRTGSYLTNYLLNMLTGAKLQDYGTMLRVFRGTIAKELARRYAAERLYLPVLLCKISRNLKEVETAHDRRMAGVSKYNFGKLVTLLVTIFCRYHVRFYRFMQKIGWAKEFGVLYRLDVKNSVGVQAPAREAAASAAVK